MSLSEISRLLATASCLSVAGAAAAAAAGSAPRRRRVDGASGGGSSAAPRLLPLSGMARGGTGPGLPAAAAACRGCHGRCCTRAAAAAAACGAPRTALRPPHAMLP